jgi:hypothetical protein
MKLTEGCNFINRAKFWYQMMWTSWSHGQTTHNDDTTPEKPKKSGLIGMWDNENCPKAPPPNEYQFANEKYNKEAIRSIIPW